MPKKRFKKCKKYFLFETNIEVLLRFLHTQGLFKTLLFRSVSLVTKKFRAILDFFLHRPDFLPPCTPYIKKKNPFHFYPLKVTKFYGDSVKN